MCFLRCEAAHHPKSPTRPREGSVSERERIMTAKVIQGLFPGGLPKLATSVQPKMMSPPIQAKSAARPPATSFAGRPPGPLGLASSGGRRPLPEAVRGKMEAAFGADFSGVRVHVGPQAERIGAIAFTLGSDIYFAPGRFQRA
jgi:hypothetical protein